jgi:phosphohistidine phosphatase
MKSIYLVRHANAGWNNSQLPDFERTLSDEGRKEASEMAGRLLEKDARPDILVSSPASRALETAGIFADRLSCPPELIRPDAGIYDGDVDTLSEIVQKLPRDHQTVMIFGHNPTISLYSSWLSGKQLGQMVTCGVIRLDLPKGNWTDAKKGCANAVWYSYPKNRQ